MYAWPVSAAALLKGNLVNNRGYAKFFPPLVLCTVLLAKLVWTLLQCIGLACSWKNVFHSHVLFTVRFEYFI